VLHGITLKFLKVFSSLMKNILKNLYFKRAFDKLIEKPFLVVNPLNLNLFKSLKKPLAVSEIKNVGCALCQSDPIEITLTLERSKI
jgi:hypothetical protein